MNGVLPIIVRVTHDHHVVLAQRDAARVAKEIGFNTNKAFSVATSASELARNLIVHAADGGTISLSSKTEGNQTGLELVAADMGPGIADIDQAMSDGYSSRGSMGEGLSAVKRLMDDFEIHSVVGEGTQVTTRMWLK